MRHADTPRWKTVDCPRCGAAAGQPCGKRRLGSINQWTRTNPHSARKQHAESLSFAVGERVVFTKSMRVCRVIARHDNGHYTVETLDTHKQMTATAQGLRRLNDWEATPVNELIDQSTFEQIAHLSQTQGFTADQLAALQRVANRLGLFPPSGIEIQLLEFATAVAPPVEPELF